LRYWATRGIQIAALIATIPATTVTNNTIIKAALPIRLILSVRAVDARATAEAVRVASFG
jgi:hypothetical protein